MSVNVIFSGPIKAATGTVKTKSNARNLKELMGEMSGRYGQKFEEEVKKTKILVNGYAIQFYDGLKTRLNPGDTVDFLQSWRNMDK